jgi:hypothetical protein
MLMKLFATAFALAALTLPAMAATDVVVTAPMAFPESLGSTPNGTLYIGSINRGEAIARCRAQRPLPPGSANSREISASCWVCWPMRNPARSMSATIRAITPI